MYGTHIFLHDVDIDTSFAEKHTLQHLVFHNTMYLLSYTHSFREEVNHVSFVLTILLWMVSCLCMWSMLANRNLINDGGHPRKEASQGLPPFFYTEFWLTTLGPPMYIICAYVLCAALVVLTVADPSSFVEHLVTLLADKIDTKTEYFRTKFCPLRYQVFTLT